jgi:hypothetical protein
VEGRQVSGGSLIDGYLRELKAQLRLPARRRQRVLVEVADHLESAVGAGGRKAERAAIEAFGPPRFVALRFVEELALDQTLRTTWLVSLATLGFCALLGLSARSAPLTQLAVQIALACAALSALRALRHRDDRALSARKLRWIVRGDVVAVGVILLAALGELAAGLLSRGPDRPGTIVTASVTAAAAMIVMSVALRASVRVRALSAVAEDPAAPDGDAFTDLLAVGRQLRLWAAGKPVLDRTLAAIEGTAQVRAAASRLRPRVQAWRAVLALAIVAGVTAGLAHGVSEGAPSLARLPMGLLAFMAIAAIEAAAVIVCFALLGGYLGIRPPLSARRR